MRIIPAFLIKSHNILNVKKNVFALCHVNIVPGKHKQVHGKIAPAFSLFENCLNDFPRPTIPFRRDISHQLLLPPNNSFISLHPTQKFSHFTLINNDKTM